MSPINPSDFHLLFDVFRFGLTYDLISTKEITAWADGIIINETEPDYFFIEVSLSNNKNTLLEILGNYPADAENPVQIRVALGLIYKKLVDGIITADNAIRIMYTTDPYERLTPYEWGWIYELDDYRDSYLNKNSYFVVELDNPTKDTLRYLSIYKDFRLDNFGEWEVINKQVDAAIISLSAKEAAAITATQQLVDNANVKRRAQQRLYMRIAIHLMAVVALIFILLTYKLIENRIPVTKFRSDFCQFSVLYFSLFVCYYVMVGIYWVMRKGFRIKV